jgi:hypothetical protein
MRRNFLALSLAAALLLPTAAFGQTVSISSAERKMAEEITAGQLSNYLYFVASDAMGGRDTPSYGLDVTAEFLKMNLQKWGFKPAGDNGTFFQKIALTREAIDPDKMSLEIGGQSYKFADDFYRVRGNGSASGPVVFGKDGWFVDAHAFAASVGDERSWRPGCRNVVLTRNVPQRVTFYARTDTQFGTTRRLILSTAAGPFIFMPARTHLAYGAR